MTKWKLVPVKALEELRNSVSGRVNMGSVWEAAVIDSMLEAAPQPPKLSDERILEIGAMAKAQWNAAADQYNQWRELDSDEITILIARAIEREILRGAYE